MRISFLPSRVHNKRKPLTHVREVKKKNTFVLSRTACRSAILALSATVSSSERLPDVCETCWSSASSSAAADVGCGNDSNGVHASGISSKKNRADPSPKRETDCARGHGRTSPLEIYLAFELLDLKFNRVEHLLLLERALVELLRCARARSPKRVSQWKPQVERK